MIHPPQIEDRDFPTALVPERTDLPTTGVASASEQPDASAASYS